MKNFDAKSFVNVYNKKLRVKNDCQDINEIRESILNMAKVIAESDLSSTFINSKRIEIMKEYLDLLEYYNKQLIAIDQKKNHHENNV